MSKAVLLQGDCLEVLKELPDNSVDSLVTDPPAGIAFMGKAWDSNKGGSKQWIAWLSSVMKEALRVLKPGAHGLVWAIPRTSHWTATALEDAGFEIRDVVTHIFGSGFPKSMDISKAIDKATGAERGSSYVPNLANKTFGAGKSKAAGVDRTAGAILSDPPVTSEAKQWQGWGTALKPASEHWLLVRKPCEEDTVAANVLKHGTGGINVDASRIGFLSEADKASAIPFGDMSKTKVYGRNSYLESKTVNKAEQHVQGRFPANLILSHNPDCVEVGVKKVKIGAPDRFAKTDGGDFVAKFNTSPQSNLGNGDGTETVPVWECTDGCAVALLDEQDNASKGVLRFFYVAKPSKSEKNAGLEVNTHPTVKSTKLMQYLITMITPPEGVVLDPFMGSGTTGVSAIKSGFRFMGIEQSEEYMTIAEARIKHAEKQ